jgi:putative NADPH-quinone reductase
MPLRLGTNSGSPGISRRRASWALSAGWLGWKAVYDEHDFPDRLDRERLSFVAESGHAFGTGTQPDDVRAEQAKLLAADAVVFQFPLWWFGMPAIMKGWIERLFAFGLAYGWRGAGNRYRYGEGGLAGKRASLSVTAGGPAADYGPRGINGPLDDLLFPITHGTLFFAGMEVLPTYAVYGTHAHAVRRRAHSLSPAERRRLSGPARARGRRRARRRGAARAPALQGNRAMSTLPHRS